MAETMRIRALAAPAVALLLLVGCQHYEIETTVHPDGSGVRTVTLDADPGGAGDPDATEVSREEFRALFGLDEARGWHLTPDSEDDDLVFTNEEEVQTAAGWSALASGIEILGTLEEGPLSEARFTEEAALETSQGPEGKSLTYRARFEWRGVKEIVIARTAEHFLDVVAERYPGMREVERAELRGLFAGHMALVLLTEINESCSLADELVTASFLGLAEPLVHASSPDADVAPLGELAVETIDGEWLDEFVSRRLPGVSLASLAGIDLRVTMPGEIIETNGEQEDSRTVSWEIDLGKAIAEPTEIYVRAVVGE